MVDFIGWCLENWRWTAFAMFGAMLIAGVIWRARSGELVGTLRCGTTGWAQPVQWRVRREADKDGRVACVQLQMRRLAQFSSVVFTPAQAREFAKYLEQAAGACERP